MADDKVKTAVDVIARRIVAMAAIAEIGALNPSEIVHDSDREAVGAHIRVMADRMDPGSDAYEAACEFLASRAGGGPDVA